MSKLPDVLATRRLRGGLFKLEELDLRFSNGVERTYRRIHNAGRGAAIVVAMPDAESVLLVREYAAGLEHYELGPPKGRLDPGEDAIQAANRELKEEAGFGARDLVVLGRLSLEPAYMDHVAYVVLARDLYPERLPGDEPEVMEVVRWRLDELHDLMARPDVTSGRALAALFMAREYLAGRYSGPTHDGR